VFEVQFLDIKETAMRFSNFFRKNLENPSWNGKWRRFVFNFLFWNLYHYKWLQRL